VIDAKIRPPGPSGGKRAVIAGALFVATLAVFWSVLPSAFVKYDDDLYVAKNVHVAGGLAAPGVVWAFTTFTAANWHPATWLSHMLDVQMFGLDAAKHHVVSLLLHAANAALVFLLLATMTGALWRSALAGALFAVHPLHVESFAWIAERKDVLSTALWLLTSLAWLRYLRTRAVGSYLLVAALYATGLMAKPMLVTLPFTLLLLDAWPLGRLAWSRTALRGNLGRLVAEKAPLFAMSAASCVVTAVAQRSGGAIQGLERFPAAGRLANAIGAYASYLEKTIWPSSLAVFYPYRAVSLLTWPTVGSIVVLAAATAAVLLAARRAPYLAFGWFWFLGTLVPVIGLVQVGLQSRADRYTYIPLIGLFVAMSWGLAELAEQTARMRTVGAAAACAWLVALAVAARFQVGTWANKRTLFEHAIAVTSDNFLAHETLGATLLDEGDVNAAVAQLNEALRLNPRFPETHYDLGLAMVRLGRSEEAISYFRRAIEIAPGLADAHNNLGGVLASVGRPDAALEEFRAAVRLDPQSRAARYNLANSLAETGRDAEAVESYSDVLRLGPRDAEVLDRLGLALTRLERWPEAIESFREQLRLRPDSAELHNSLGYALARAGRMTEALQEFQEAVRIAPGDEEAAGNLLKAKAALGQP
jgi:protein O-mannosyl-transferase